MLTSVFVGSADINQPRALGDKRLGFVGCNGGDSHKDSLRAVNGFQRGDDLLNGGMGNEIAQALRIAFAVD